MSPAVEANIAVPEGCGQLLDGLNEQQRAAVTAPRQNMLISAGAGTGKTTVLVARIVWLMKAEHVHPRNILALTFTNKAAAQMRERIGAKLGTADEMRYLWAGTFHSFCYRLLRAYATQIGLSPQFTVLDNSSQVSFIKRIALSLGITLDAKTGAREVRDAISLYKRRGLRADRCAEAASRGKVTEQAQIEEIYREYERQAAAENLVDFDEMLLKVREMLENHEHLRELQQSRFKEVLVDEFQDTSGLQYDILRLICGPDTHLQVVGDDDQSIYGWRGADFRLMERFVDDTSNFKLYKLEANYRSGGYILDAANEIISRSTERLTEKKLFPAFKDAGEPIWVLPCYTMYDEAERIVRLIRDLHTMENIPYAKMAVLYRNNNQSLALEEELSQQQVPYVVYGGLKFFERKEILDVIAYLRILLNEKDNEAVLRVINRPARGLGPAKIKALTDESRRRTGFLLETMRALRAGDYAGGDAKALKKLAGSCGPFLALLDSLEQARGSMSLSEFVRFVTQETGLWDYYAQQDSKDQASYGDVRQDNLTELVNHALQYEQRGASDALMLPDEAGSDESDDAGALTDPLFEFVSHAMLVSSTELTASGDEGEAQNGELQMMTIHAAKGLEFPVVFMIGVEESILPSWRNKSQAEERRLAYVGMTRAKHLLYLSYCQERRVGRDFGATGPSCYITELISAFGQKGPIRVKRVFGDRRSRF